MSSICWNTERKSGARHGLSRVGEAILSTLRMPYSRTSCAGAGRFWSHYCWWPRLAELECGDAGLVSDCGEILAVARAADCSDYRSYLRSAYMEEWAHSGV